MKKLALGLVLAGLTTSLFCGCAHSSNPAAALATTQVSQTSETSEDGLDYAVPMDLGVDDATASESSKDATASSEVATASTPVEEPEATVSAPVVMSDLLPTITAKSTVGYFSWKKLEINVQVRNPYFYRRAGLMKVQFLSKGSVVESLTPVQLQFGAAEIRNYTYRSTVLADDATVSIEAL